MVEQTLQSKVLNRNIEQMRCSGRPIKKWIENDKEDSNDKTRSQPSDYKSMGQGMSGDISFNRQSSDDS